VAAGNVAGIEAPDRPSAVAALGPRRTGLPGRRRIRAGSRSNCLFHRVIRQGFSSRTQCGRVFAGGATGLARTTDSGLIARRDGVRWQPPRAASAAIDRGRGCHRQRVPAAADEPAAPPVVPRGVIQCPRAQDGRGRFAAAGAAPADPLPAWRQRPQPPGQSEAAGTNERRAARFPGPAPLICVTARRRDSAAREHALAGDARGAIGSSGAGPWPDRA